MTYEGWGRDPPHSVTPCSLVRAKAGRIRCEKERERTGCPHRYALNAVNGYAPRWYDVKSFCQRSVESLGWSTRDRGRLRPLRIFESTTRIFPVHSKGIPRARCQAGFYFSFLLANTLKDITLNLWNTSVVYLNIINLSLIINICFYNFFNWPL